MLAAIGTARSARAPRSRLKSRIVYPSKVFHDAGGGLAGGVRAPGRARPREPACSAWSGVRGVGPGSDEGLHGRDGSVAATRSCQRQSADGGQDEQRRRHRQFEGDRGGLDDRHGARGGDGARLRCRAGEALLSEPGMAAGRRLCRRRGRPVGADDAAPLAVLDPLREGRPGHHGDGARLPSEGVPGGQGHRRRPGRSRQPRRRRQRRGGAAEAPPGSPTCPGARTSRTRRSATRTATAGCSRRSRPGCPVGNGRTDMDVASLADLLHETAEHHGSYEAIAPPHDWWDCTRHT
jgi:hypothetical protein